jgi:C-terminal processing protease CtpA/Prc
MRILVAILLCAAALPAQNLLSEQEVRASMEAKERARKGLWEAKDYRAAVRLLEEVVADPALRRYPDLHLNNLYNLACAYALAGDAAKAVARLRELLDLGYRNVPNIQRDTDFDSIRTDPSYLAAIAEMKAIPDFWDGPAWKTPYQADLPENDKIAGLSRFWSEVKYNFAWFEHLPRDFDWDALYVSYIPKVRATHSTLEYYRVLQELCARLKDAHTSVDFPGALSREVYGIPGVSTRFIEGRVLLSEVWDPALKQDGVVPGLEIVAIDGMPVKQYGAERVSPYQSASTAQDLDVHTFEYGLLQGKIGVPVELTLRAPDGGTFQGSLPRGTSNGAAPRRLPDFEFKMLPGNIAYLALNTFGTATAQKEFERQFDEIAKSSALIFDVRNNGGGNSGYGTAILSHLIEKPTAAEEWRSREYVPAKRAWGNPPGWTGGTPMTQPSRDRRYGNPVVVLTSPRTGSAAEDFTIDFDLMGRGKIIGEPTGGSTGQPLSFPLPGGGSARVCTKQNLYPDGRQFVGVGIQPQILIRPNVADFRAGRDTVLEKALDYLRANLATVSARPE